MRKIYYTLLALSLATTPLVAKSSKRKQKRQHNKSLMHTIAQNKIVWGTITLLALGGGALYLKKNKNTTDDTNNTQTTTNTQATTQTKSTTPQETTIVLPPPPTQEELKKKFSISTDDDNMFESTFFKNIDLSDEIKNNPSQEDLLNHCNRLDDSIQKLAKLKCYKEENQKIENYVDYAIRQHNIQNDQSNKINWLKKAIQLRQKQLKLLQTIESKQDDISNTTIDKNTFNTNEQLNNSRRAYLKGEKAVEDHYAILHNVYTLKEENQKADE